MFELCRDRQHVRVHNADRPRVHDTWLISSRSLRARRSIFRRRSTGSCRWPSCAAKRSGGIPAGAASMSRGSSGGLAAMPVRSTRSAERSESCCGNCSIRRALPPPPWAIAGETRENFFVDEISAGQQYRFILPGPRLHEAEWKECLNLVSALDPFPRYLVASGSLPMASLKTSIRRWRESAKQRGPGSCWIRRDRHSPRQWPKASISSSRTCGKCVS